MNIQDLAAERAAPPLGGPAQICIRVRLKTVIGELFA